MGYILNIAKIVENSSIYGPGQRYVIWVQGCNIRCTGCWNPEMHSTEPKELIATEDLTNRIINNSDIEGITILGGEPLHQSKPLLDLVYKVKEHGLTVMLYTGYEKEEIHDKASQVLMNLADIVVIGRYMESQRSIDLTWRGSRNQSILFNNEKYRELYEEQGEENQIEIHIRENGEIEMMGYPPEELRKEVFN